MKCNICDSETQPLFTKKILQKYEVLYYKCKNCFFVQTESPFWINEAYESAITKTDIGLIFRNQYYSEILSCMLRMFKFPKDSIYLDYGGGTGIFVRMMRDLGFNFWWSDKYCENIYSQKFSLQESTKYKIGIEAITAFEVFEHLTEPQKTIDELLRSTDTLIFSTDLIPDNLNIEDWWYLMPEHGQHVSFYDKRTLKYISHKYGLNLYSYKNLHILTNKKFSKLFLKLSSSYKFSSIYNILFANDGLLEKDYQLYLNDLKNENIL